jgi:hypothetical protein
MCFYYYFYIFHIRLKNNKFEKFKVDIYILQIISLWYLIFNIVCLFILFPRPMNSNIFCRLSYKKMLSLWHKSCLFVIIPFLNIIIIDDINNNYYMINMTKIKYKTLVKLKDMYLQPGKQLIYKTR